MPSFGAISEFPIEDDGSAPGHTDYTLSLAYTTFSLVGFTTTQSPGWNMNVGYGAFTFTGIAATLGQLLILTAAVGTFALSGQAVTFSVATAAGYILIAAVGAFALRTVSTVFRRFDHTVTPRQRTTEATLGVQRAETPSLSSRRSVSSGLKQQRGTPPRLGR